VTIHLPVTGVATSALKLSPGESADALQTVGMVSFLAHFETCQQTASSAESVEQPFLAALEGFEDFAAALAGNEQIRAAGSATETVPNGLNATPAAAQTQTATEICVNIGDAPSDAQPERIEVAPVASVEPADMAAQAAPAGPTDSAALLAAIRPTTNDSGASISTAESPVAAAVAPEATAASEPTPTDCPEDSSAASVAKVSIEPAQTDSASATAPESPAPAAAMAPARRSPSKQALQEVSQTPVAPVTAASGPARRQPAVAPAVSAETSAESSLKSDTPEDSGALDSTPAPQARDLYAMAASDATVAGDAAPGTSASAARTVSEPSAQSLQKSDGSEDSSDPVPAPATPTSEPAAISPSQLTKPVQRAARSAQANPVTQAAAPRGTVTGKAGAPDPAPKSVHSSGPETPSQAPAPAATAIDFSSDTNAPVSLFEGSSEDETAPAEKSVPSSVSGTIPDDVPSESASAPARVATAAAPAVEPVPSVTGDFRLPAAGGADPTPAPVRGATGNVRTVARPARRPALESVSDRVSSDAQSAPVISGAAAAPVVSVQPAAAAVGETAAPRSTPDLGTRADAPGPSDTISVSKTPDPQAARLSGELTAAIRTEEPQAAAPAGNVPVPHPTPAERLAAGEAVKDWKREAPEAAPAAPSATTSPRSSDWVVREAPLANAAPKTAANTTTANSVRLSETAEPALMAEPATAKAPAPIKGISIQIGQAAQEKVELRVTQQAGEVRVAVRAADPDVAHSIRQSLPDLVNHLEQSGIRAEAWRPGGVATGPTTNAAVRLDSPETRGGDSQQQRGWTQQDRDQRNPEQQNQRPKWVEELESPTTGGGPVFTGEWNVIGS
jgi:hypothetical protein